MHTVRTETEAGVCSIILCRPDQYNTITPTLRDELAAAIDAADADQEGHVILLRADGPAFCAGYGLDWSTDGRGLFISSSDPRRSTLIYVTREGEVHKLWEPSASATTWGIQSFDGKHVAVLGGSFDSNVWMIEDF